MICLLCKRSISMWSKKCPYCSQDQTTGRIPPLPKPEAAPLHKIAASRIDARDDDGMSWLFGLVGAVLGSVVGMNLGGLGLSVLLGMAGAGAGGALKAYVRAHDWPQFGRQPEIRAKESAAEPLTSGYPTDHAKRLRRLDRLRDDGVITDKERTEARRRILNEL